MNRHLLIFLDKTFFRIAFYCVVIFSNFSKGQRHSSKNKDHALDSFLIIRPGGIGDGLMSLPLLKNMRQHCPQNKVTLICLKKNQLAYKHVSCFDELIVLDTPSGLLRTLQLFWKRTFDVVFDLEPFRKVSALVAYFSRATIRIGFDTNNRRALYTHLTSYPNEKYYESFNMVRQLQAVGLNIPEDEAQDLSFSLPDNDVEAARASLISKGIAPERDFIVALAPGVLKKHHRWHMPHFSRLIQLMRQDDARVKILLLGVPADIPDSQAVLAHLSEDSRPVNFVGETSYTQSLAILKFCKILVACDGGIVYMAAAMGCSTLSIWGPGVMERFKPPGENHPGIRKNYACVPCVNYSRLGEFPDCPYDRKCINDISPESVFSAYRSLKDRLQTGHDYSHAVRAC